MSLPIALLYSPSSFVITELPLDSLPAGFLDGYDFYYFKLHGLKDQPYWYGDGWLTAIASETIVGLLTPDYYFGYLEAAIDEGVRKVRGN